MSSVADKAMSTLAYSGAVVAPVAGMTLTDWGIIVGIATALLTFFANQYYQRRKDRREQALYDLEVEQIRQARVEAAPKQVWPPVDHDVPAQ